MADTGIDADVTVIGAGIVGLATARALLVARPGLAVVVVEKEQRPGVHQTGHNSGVLHSGVYYPPGSAKAELCRAGKAELEAWCADVGIEVRRRGKVVVATDVGELGRLDELRRRSVANGVACRVVDRRGLATLEPHVAGIAALHVPGTAVVDFGAVASELAREVVARGGLVRTGFPVVRIETTADGRRRIVGPDGQVTTAALVTCAGLHSDRVARLAGARPELAIVPFRGEYHALRPGRDRLVRSLVYPVPDPRLPFLGVHATRDVHGHVHLGPNAVLALRREGYRWRDVDPGDLLELVGSAQARGLARRWWATGAQEVARSISGRAFLRAARRLLPDLEPGDLVRDGAGVRAQAVRPDGSLVDDFAIVGDDRAVHVLNAPSPAATASFAIGRTIASQVLDVLG